MFSIKSISKKHETINGYTFIGPSLICILVLTAFPLLYGFYVSFFETDLVNNWDFVGFSQYINVFTNSDFYKSLWITLKFTFFVVVGHFAIGTVLAIILNRKLPGRTIFRTIFILPWILPEVCVALIFKWMLNPAYGMVNQYLLQWDIVEKPISWLGSTEYALPAVIFICIWKGFPLIMILVMAGLSTISEDIYEAAVIDGCTAIQKFLYITVPCLKPVLLSALILDTVWWFKHYTMVWLLTGGGPNNATNIVSINIYKEAFDFFNYGTASALAVIVFIVCFAIGIIYRRALDNENQ